MSSPALAKESGSSIEPALCRVAVLGGNAQFDVGLPAEVPVAVLIPDLVALIQTRVPNLGGEGSQNEARNQWTLGRVGQAPIPLTKTLAEAGVYDGDLLILRAVAAEESPLLFDDVIDAVSRVNQHAFRHWGPNAARYLGMATLVVASFFAARLLFLYGSVPHESRFEDFLAPVLCIVWGVFFHVSGWIIGRRYHQHAISNVLCWCGVPFIFFGVMVSVPGDTSKANVWGLSSVWAACTVTFVIAIISSRISTSGTVLHTAIATFTLLLGLAYADMDIFHHSYQVVGAALVCAAIFIISAGSKFAIALAKLPLPPVPTAGQAVDAEEIDLHPSVEGIGAIGAMALPNAKDLEQRAKASNHYLTGLVIASSLIAIGGALAAARPTAAYPWQGPVLATIVAIVLVLRGRSFTDLVQASVMIGSGFFLFVALIYGGGRGSLQNQPWIALALGVALVLFSIAFLIIGVVVPNQTYSPVMRRAGEVFEYTLIAFIFPLVFWIMGLYSAVRNIEI
ncbi:type VII secretion integral membrane protein EccD [Segniliparus rugosus]|uniref:Type VII secretion integral membrane protein EccD n=1 Tax=Segniliparus rugosus (strain ATCC BAA-974 / DSM 45345 / CCUG 50838 / CIP 108380 / JCM 13579 / CDC 945) TaxID=679197 RepID=U1M1F1_SEGRC|nr:type VII secretion integral membrane protein EccD [Segniliparus rugosus]ERG69212.1 type VII secretion integral membrane protein EccD [Segniliparus rugosus ATCC BAA-974]